MTLPKFKQDDVSPHEMAAPAGGHGRLGNGSGPDSFDEPHKKMPKALKWAAGTALGLVLLAGVGGVVATQLIDQQKYKTLIVSKVEESTGYRINWEGNISIGMMPLPHATVHKLTVESQGTQMLSIEKANVEVALTPLLSKKLLIRNVSLDQPIVRLVTTKAGVQTWTPKAKAEKPDGAVTTTTEDGEEFEIIVKGVDMNEGSFFIDNQQSASLQEFKDINLNIRADSMTGPFDVKGDTKWSGKKVDIKVTSGETNAAEGNYPIQASISIPDIDGEVSFAGVVNSNSMSAKGDIDLDVENIGKAAKEFSGKDAGLPEGLDGKASLAGKVEYTSDRVALDDLALSVGTLSYSGHVTAEGLENKNAEPQVSFQLTPKARAASSAPQLVQLLSDLTIAAKGSIQDEKIQIVNANLKAMGNNISVTGNSTMGANPAVDLTINASEINLDALTNANAGSAEGTAKSAASSAATKPSDMGFTVPFSGRVRADVAKLVTGGKTYSNIKADVMSKGGSLAITRAEVSLPQESNVNVTGTIGNTAALSGLNLKVAAQTKDAEKLMTSFGVTPPELPAKITAASLNGSFSGDLKNLGFSTTISALKFNVKGDGTVGDPLGTPVINSLKFNVTHPNFNEALKTFQPGFSGSSGFFGPMDLSGQLAWGETKFDLSGLNGKLGQTTINGDLSAVTEPKAKVSGALNFGTLVFPSATNNGGTVEATPSSAPAQAKGERWSRDPIDTAWMKSFDADLTIKAKSITQNMWKLNDANLAFKLADGVLTLDDVSAGLFGGHASINGVIKSGAGAKDPLSINAQMKADSVNAQELMSAVMGKVSYVLSGTLSKVDVSVNAMGSSAANLIQTLGGNGAMNGKDITVTGVDIVALSNAAGGSYKPLDRLGALSKSVGSSNQTKFDTFDSEFTIENGIVNLKKTMFDNTDASMNTTGNVNLPAWTLNLTNKLTMKSNEAEPITFTINGSLDNPAQSGLQNLLLNRVDKLINKDGTKLNKVLGKFLGTPQTDAVAPAPEATGTTGTEAAPAAAPATEGTNSSAAPVAPAPEKTKEQKKAEKAEEAVKAIQGLFGR